MWSEIVLVEGERIGVAAVLRWQVGENILWSRLAPDAVGGRHLVRTRRDLRKLMNIL